MKKVTIVADKAKNLDKLLKMVEISPNSIKEIKVGQRRFSIITQEIMENALLTQGEFAEIFLKDNVYMQDCPYSA